MYLYIKDVLGEDEIKSRGSADKKLIEASQNQAKVVLEYSLDYFWWYICIMLFLRMYKFIPTYMLFSCLCLC